jgi:hypothetical protein
MAWLLGESSMVCAYQFQVHRRKTKTTRFKALQWKLNGEIIYWARNVMQRGNPLAQGGKYKSFILKYIFMD